MNTHGLEKCKIADLCAFFGGIEEAEKAMLKKHGGLEGLRLWVVGKVEPQFREDMNCEHLLMVAGLHYFLLEEFSSEGRVMQ